MNNCVFTMENENNTTLYKTHVAYSSLTPLPIIILFQSPFKSMHCIVIYQYSFDLSYGSWVLFIR